MNPGRLHPIHYVAGWIIWAIWFVAAYGGLAVACKIEPPAPEQGIFNWLNLSFFVITMVVFVLLCLYAVDKRKLLKEAPPQTKFALQIATAVYAFSAFGTLMVGLALVMVTPCL
ncbi:hypothetical protein [Alteromonas ponticola]|uniref:Transmembrane protein n=1 Tax=Alteromonas ponticola TaxID=2720613 RepID=A0ABX1QYU4_9ALTE|nr:hypothetical protein [Alteromonas ponticola]NMH59384.1 hypothetical protein [Alteromonas ponticola]